MQILSVASEAYPLIKTGGLADVAGALPPALARQGIGMRTLLPGYPAVTARLEDAQEVHAWRSLIGASARLLAAKAGGLDLIVLDAPEFFDRPGNIYLDPEGRDWGDNWRRFAALSKAAAEIAAGILPGWRPDLVHAHDWQAGLLPAYLRYYAVDVPSVLTIHNLAFQGHYPAAIFGGLELPPQAFALDGVEYFGGVGYLKAGIAAATAVTTVSPTYADEIRTPAEGMALDGLLRSRSADLVGIVNGIDVDVWNPETDPALAGAFSARSPKGRAKNRAAIEATFGLHRDDAPIFCVVSRLTGQKGMDLMVDATWDLVAAGGKLAVLGSGDAGLEGALFRLAGEFPGRVGVVIGYDEPLAHRMQGGADAILIPSRFEPCGLTQLYGLRYGCVPVVSRVGGLADTVIDANVAALNAGVATGIQFAPVDADTLRAAVRRAIGLYRTPHWAAMQRAGMRSDVSWDRSAALYADLYRRVTPDANE
ncbi:glycogen synthase GlgA [Amaricoccus sp.]|uniref:glycogen synthase GlgA n=1 Tax=Amaricoccus sp. TaxID=1872485 RepID=UPI001B62757D|nr:glycogen synthase GlgA [Amaricoccus sp.]MBP7002805.1 glycogen synthase GlgA [Amaricoccus sp.]